MFASGARPYHQPVSVAPIPTPEHDTAALRGRLLALVVRPTARPLRWGVVVAVAFIAAEALLVLQLKRIAPENTFGAVFLLGVLVVSAGWGFGLALATTLASALVYMYFHLIEGTSSLVPAVIVFLSVALLANVLAGQARLRAAEADQRRSEAEASRAAASALAKQQNALRRVATLVARGAEPAEVYPVAVEELARGLGVEHVTLVSYEADDGCVVLAARDQPARPGFAAGDRVSLEGDSVCAAIHRTGEPARIDDYTDAEGTLAARLRELGLKSGAGVPVMVAGELRGALIIGSGLPGPMRDETESGIRDFADLIATAIANSETRAELTASRARIVAAADQARRGFERDLHDGAQQRIVSLGLELRALEAAVPADNTDLQSQVAHAISDLSHIHTDLQEFSRGIHPAILSKGGLGPAIKTLARRSTVPVALDLNVGARLPESVEVATYYVIAEALTNAAKYAQAAEVRVHASIEGSQLKVSVVDDGIGGALLGTGSGLVGLKDRVEALSGRIDVASPPGEGTTLTVEIPLPGD
jgi:signal transduction histidine kinase